MVANLSLAVVKGLVAASYSQTVVVVAAAAAAPCHRCFVTMFAGCRVVAVAYSSFVVVGC